jgi:hypothetical protein
VGRQNILRVEALAGCLAIGLVGHVEARFASMRISTRIETSHVASYRSNVGKTPTGVNHATCKSASCFQKHATGDDMIPLFAKS